jgi:hypothetical protein
MTNADQQTPRMARAEASVLDSDPRSIARLLDPGADEERIWDADELAAILRHQLAAPIQVDLNSLEAGAAPRLRMLTEAHGLLLKSFGDLLRHPHPPLELLKLTKNFAKALRLSRRGTLPREIATVLYFASIVVALRRCRRRISRLDDAALRRGVELCLRQPWLDDSTRELFQEGLQALRDNGGSALSQPPKSSQNH